MKPNDVTFDSYAEYNEGSNEKDPKFTVGDCVRIPKYKDIFAKGYTENWPEETLIIRKIEIQFHRHMLLVTWTYVIVIMYKNCKKKSKRIQNRKDN